MPVGDVVVGGRRRLPTALLGALAAVVALAGLGFVLGTGGTADDDVPPGADASETPTPDDRDPLDVADAFLAAWAAEDWEALQSLVADQDLAAGETHRLAHDILDVTATTLAPGELQRGDGQARVPFDARWELADLGVHDFSSELTLEQTAQGWRVRWWYPTLHPDLTPERRFERVRRFPERAPILGPDGGALVSSERRVVVAFEPRRATNGPGPVIDAVVDHTGADRAEIEAVVTREDLDPAGRHPLVELPVATFAEVRGVLAPVPGIVFEERQVRAVAASPALASLLGSVGEVTAELLAELGPPYRAGDAVGRSGIERAYERRLAGQPAEEARIMEGDALVTSLAFSEGSPGEPVTVTLGTRAQEAAEAALAPLAEPAALVAVDARNGEVRALVSHPADGFPRARTGRYPPGSTFKIVDAAALLAAGVRPDEPVACPPQVRIGGREIGNASDFDAGTVSLVEAFARSCNTTFAQRSTDLGAQRLTEAARLFGFDVAYDVGLESFGGRFPEPADAAELASAAIGQARVEASPLHMASVAAAARSGVWRSPHLVRELVDVVETPLPPGVSGPLGELMRAVVTSGTGQAANLPGVAGKTGSAQFGDGARTHAWFVGFRDDLAVAVVVEGGGGGGAVAAPVAARFLEALQP